MPSSTLLIRKALRQLERERLRINTQIKFIKIATGTPGNRKAKA